jgi:Zn-dependent protease with chaperone function
METLERLEMIRAVRFGPGYPPAGEPVSVGIDSSGLHLSSKESGEETIPFDPLRVSAGGFDHDQMILIWRHGAETESLVISDSDSKMKFLAHAPSLLAPQLSRWQKKIGRNQKRTWGGGMLLLLLLLSPLLLAFGIWWQSDHIAAWAVDRISIDSEEQIGDLIYRQARLGFDILPEGEAVKAVREIGNRLTRGEPYPFEWHVAENPAVNAFAIPGGHVVVFTGLIRAAESPEELAGVLAHEIEHVTQRHTLKALVHDFGWQAVLAISLGEWGGSGPWGEYAAEMGRLTFGRHQELDADRKGLARLKKTGINPSGMIAFFEKLSQGEEMAIPLLSTHPSGADRVGALRAEIKRLGPWEGNRLPIDWKKVKAGLK